MSFENTGKLEFRRKQCPRDTIRVPTMTLAASFIFSRLDNQLGTLCDLEFSLFLKKVSVLFNKCISNTYYVQDLHLEYKEGYDFLCPLVGWRRERDI